MRVDHIPANLIAPAPAGRRDHLVADLKSELKSRLAKEARAGFREKEVKFTVLENDVRALSNVLSTELISCRSGQINVNGQTLYPGDIAFIYPGTVYDITFDEPSSVLTALHPAISGLCHLPYHKPQDTSGPKVSIVIIACNVEQYVSWAIASALRQTHANVEVLVAVDQSTDQTLDQVRAWGARDDRVVVIDQVQGTGPNAMRRAGLVRASGEFFLIIDGDDWLAEDAIELLLAKADEKQSDCVAFGYRLYNDSNREFWQSVLPDPTEPIDGPVFEETSAWAARRAARMNHTFWAYFCASSLKERALQAIVDLSYYEDLPYYPAVLANAERPATLNRALYFYRRERVGQLTYTWNDVRAGHKMACLETAAALAVVQVPPEKWVHRTALFYKIARVIDDEIKGSISRKDASAVRGWHVVLQRVCMLFPSSTLHKLRGKTTIEYFVAGRRKGASQMLLRKHLRLAGAK